MIRISSSVLAMAVSIAASGAALGQDGTASPAVTATIVAQGASGDPDAAEIIVTGEKVERSVQETTTSVAVTTRERIAGENIQTLQEVFQRTANVSQTYGDAGFTIRGIANRGVSGGGDAPLSTIYIDGAPIPDQIIANSPTDLWDVAQVEIFRGPQSTLQGLNALAGAVVIRTQDPTMEWTGAARASYADYETYSLAGAIGGPIIPGELAFRISAERRESDGYVFNVTRSEPEAAIESFLIRGRLLFTPSALPGFEARLSYTHFDRTAGYDFVYSRTDTQSPFADRVSFNDAANSSDGNGDFVTLEMTQELSPVFSISSVTSWSDVSQVRAYDNDFTAVPESFGGNNSTAETWTQELRLNVNNDWLNGVAGLFYYNRDQFNRTTALTTIPTPVQTAALLLQQAGLDAATANFVANLYAQALPVIPVAFDGKAPTRVETYAAFADARIALSDRLTLLVGARWDRESNEITVDQVATFAGTYPDPAAFGQLAPLIAGLNAGVAQLVAAAGGGALPTADRTFEAFLPKAGIEMAWTPDIATAFVVQRGYRSGGNSSNLATTQVVPYDPEYTWNYELSFRSRWLDGALTFNANAFYIDWTDQQVNVVFDPENVFNSNTVNAGRSHLYGFEAELTHRPHRNVDYYVSVGHTVTEFDEFTVTQGAVSDLSGLEFVYAPRWTLAAGVNVRTDMGLAFNLNASHRTDVFTDVTRPQEQWRVDARTVVNARISYALDAFTVSAFANNLLDEQYIQYNSAARNSAVLGAPRVFGVMLEGRF